MRERLPVDKKGVFESRGPGGLEMAVADHGMIEDLVELFLRSSEHKVRIRLGQGSRARFAFTSEEAGAFEIRFEVGTGAFADIFYVDRRPGRADKLSIRTEYALKSHASVNIWALSFGGSAQIDQIIDFSQPHGFAAAHGLSLLSDQDDAVHSIRANHGAGHCISRQFYKSVVGEKSRFVFDSLVSVAKGADKSDSRQLNKNLVLSREARAVSRPELKIEADDVACSHGSATGRLDEAALFYFRSRGLDERAARLMLAEGFASEILEDAPPIPLREGLTALIKNRVAEVVGP